MGGAVWRKRHMDRLGDQGDIAVVIERRSDSELASLMENLGGNCVQTMADIFASIDRDRPACFFAYTNQRVAHPHRGTQRQPRRPDEQDLDGGLAGTYGRCPR